MSNRPPPLPPRPQSQPTSQQRFWRPATLPSSDVVPASQASEYICHEKCTGRAAGRVLWFKSDGAPDFLVCTTCFERHIRYTPLAATFTGRLQKRVESGICMFDNPRVQELLWPPEKRLGSLARIHAYMVERSKLPGCRGMAGLNGAQARACGMRWYTLAQDAIPEFLACQICLEEQVVGSRLRNVFTPRSTMQGDPDQWSCDLAVPYIKRLVKWASQSGDWFNLIEGIIRRLHVTPCPSGSPVKASSRTWHRPQAWSHASVCDPCYLDHVALTWIDNEFVDMPVPFRQRQMEWTCDLASLPAQEATEMAVVRQDVALLHRFFKLVTTHPACTAKGIVGGKWYTLRGGCPNFDICAICYTGLIEIYHLDSEFQPRTDARSDQLLGCDFCPGIGR